MGKCIGIFIFREINCPKILRYKIRGLHLLFNYETMGMDTDIDNLITKTNKEIYLEAMSSGNYSLLCEASNELPSTPGVYGIFNKESNKIYIGSSKNVKHRVSAHLSTLRSGQHLCNEMNLHFLSDSEPFIYFFIDGMEHDMMGDKGKNLLIFEAKIMLLTPKEMLYNNQIPVLCEGEGEFSTEPVTTITVSDICRSIDMTADAIRANGLSFSDSMLIDDAIEFVRNRTVARGRWTAEKAEKSILYLAELERIKTESNIQISWECRREYEKDPIREQVRDLYRELNPERKKIPLAVEEGEPGAISNPVSSLPTPTATNYWRLALLSTALILPTAASVTNTFRVSHALSNSELTGALITGVASLTAILFLLAGVRGWFAVIVVAVTIGFEAFCNAVSVFKALMGSMAYYLTRVSGQPSQFLDMVSNFTGRDHQDCATITAVFVALMIAAAQVAAIQQIRK